MTRQPGYPLDSPIPINVDSSGKLFTLKYHYDFTMISPTEQAPSVQTRSSGSAKRTAAPSLQGKIKAKRNRYVSEAREAGPHHRGRGDDHRLRYWSELHAGKGIPSNGSCGCPDCGKGSLGRCCLGHTPWRGLVLCAVARHWGGQPALLAAVDSLGSGQWLSGCDGHQLRHDQA